jgi:tripartite-type tricarboxylate transporter receptor subunit TctC
MAGLLARILVCIAACALFALASAQAWAQPYPAQSYPDKPVRILVGFAPGGSSDIVARLLAQHLSPLFGQPVLVENRPGAAGIPASDVVAKAPPDGYLLLLATAGHPTAAAIMRKLPFDPVTDFAWVSMLTTYPFVIATGAQSSLKTLGDVIAQAKAAPGKLSFASTGAGAAQHMLPEWFSAETGIELLHVPFKGGTQPVTEVMSGRIDLLFDTVTLLLPHVKSGKLHGIAVTSPQAMPYLPQVPPAAQTVPGFVFQSWLGIAAPPATPRTIVDRLNRDIRRALSEPEVGKKLAELGGGAAPSSPEEMRAQIESEIARWRKTVDARHIERQ